MKKLVVNPKIRNYSFYKMYDLENDRCVEQSTYTILTEKLQFITSLYVITYGLRLIKVKLRPLKNWSSFTVRLTCEGEGLDNLYFSRKMHIDAVLKNSFPESKRCHKLVQESMQNVYKAFIKKLLKTHVKSSKSVNAHSVKLSEIWFFLKWWNSLTHVTASLKSIH